MYSNSVPALISKNVGNTLTNYKTWGGLIYNVKSYDAVGGGIIDDTAKIQAAINAAKTALDAGTIDRAIIDLANCTYLISSGLTLYANMELRNGKIKWTTTSAIDVVTVANYCTIRNVHFYGSGAIGTAITALYQRAIYGTTANNVKVLRCRFENMTVGIWSGPASTDPTPTNWEVLNNHFENIVGFKGQSEGYAVLFTPSSYGIIADNTFKTITRHPIYLAGGAQYNLVDGNIIDTADNVGIQINTFRTQNPSQHNKITNNNISNITKTFAYGYSSSVGIGVYNNSPYNTIEGNTISAFQDIGIQVSSADATGILGIRNTINNNTIIALTAINDCAIRIDNADDYTVNNNTIVIPNGVYGIAQGFDVAFVPAFPSVISKNVITCLGTGAFGLRLISTGIANHIDSNIIKNSAIPISDASSGNIYSEPYFNKGGAYFPNSITATLTPGKDYETQYFNSAVGASDIDIILSRSGGNVGAKFRIVRTVSASGAGRILVKDNSSGSSAMVIINAGDWAQLEYTTTGVWVETGKGTL